MLLLAVPFTPTHAEYIYLMGRNVLADQMEFLRAHFPRSSPLLRRGPRRSTRRATRRHAPQHRRALRLAPRQHHRCHAAAECLGSGLAPVLAAQRLGFQLDLAARGGYGGRLQQRGGLLLDRLGALFDHAPAASLLHGDLWGGNFSGDADGNPVIFDPACYYGDREADIAMTELFGGFSARFYDAYDAAWPLDAGYETRKTLYNLYHILNHLNLFGGGYATQASG
jgi:hypothetical protein